MQTIKEELGKVTITCNGQYDGGRNYERLCLVHDGFYASYISRKEVPAGTPLSDEEYWQPIAKLKENLVIDYMEFQKEVVELIATIQRALKGTRMVVNTMEDRDALTYQNVAVGCEVYVVETQQSWVLDEITPVSNQKVWHLEQDSTIDSVYKQAISGTFPRAIAERAVADELGINIHDNYLKRNVIVNYVASVLKQYFVDNAVNILDGQITINMLDETVKQMFTGAQITNVADGEDLTTVDNVLKFADKLYNIPQYSGLARKYLRKNMVAGVNILTQEMINEPNTIYIVQYDYCLDNKTITLPDNSIILWQGGKFYEGSVKLNKCRILTVYRQQDIFDKDTINLDGDWCTGQILYHPLDLGEDNKQVELSGWGGSYSNDFYWFWDGSKWVSMGFDLSVYLTREEFEMFRKILREEMEKFYAWLQAELKKINDHLTQIDGEIENIHNDITNINNTISNLENEINNKLGDINNQINNITNNIGDQISNLEEYINNKIQEILQNINNSTSGITDEYKQYFEDNFLSFLKNSLKAGDNITIIEENGQLIISSTGGGGSGGGGLTTSDVTNLINAALENYYTKQEINDIIAGISGGGGSGDVPLMTTIVAGKAKCGTHLMMSVSSSSAPDVKDRLDVNSSTLAPVIEAWLLNNGWTKGGGGGNSTVGLQSATVQGWLNSILPIGSIMLWDGSQIPAGWEIYTAAQGRFVMGFITGGINVYDGNFNNDGNWSNVLTSVGSTYAPGGGVGASTSYYGFCINSDNLPSHQHMMAVGRAKAGDNNHYVIMPSNWRASNSQDLENDVRGTTVYGTDGSNTNNLGISKAGGNTYLSGPNYKSGSSTITFSTSINRNNAAAAYLNINKMLPTIALHYIKRKSNPWE